jgi:hypothetical protein
MILKLFIGSSLTTFLNSAPNKIWDPPFLQLMVYFAGQRVGISKAWTSD